MKISEVIAVYKRKGLPEREALILIAKYFEKTKEYILAHNDIECPDEVLKLLDKRLSGYPLQYILGEAEFYGRAFYISEGVLIPRWETEGLVELAIGYIKEYNLKNLIDIGLGSGIIAVTLALETGVFIYGTDVSKKALEVAQKNADRYGIKCDFRLGAFADPFVEIWDNIEMVVSNPPYVRSDAKLQKELSYEPPEALFAGPEGLDFYKEFFKKYNIDGKIVLMEIGHDQGNALRELTGGQIIKDLAGKDRYLVVNRKE
ncbi:MAG: peptide chain release factor N(5)-glutamine methyltransferase [Fervidobacterium sp.]|uniref:peptide chain release factor N(5)-glutamine methyltransferase n=1 Tax=Fervidobacterium TaxID=2422 RepID=UPI0021FF688A|nr:SAM-dependent methyltransferase [Fervidobacterium riparium]